jgi:hypothetical protein
MTVWLLTYTVGFLTVTVPMIDTERDCHALALTITSSGYVTSHATPQSTPHATVRYLCTPYRSAAPRWLSNQHGTSTGNH